MTKKYPCPQCGKETEYLLENDYRPFCSERCKLIDLGKWADEEYKVPSEEPATEGPWVPEDSESEDQFSPQHLPSKEALH
ncbi:MAG: DNA gyrase inhibitor YacG [Bdellovibrionales bacterium]|nr:DNA gyrase inhibitor YacG [Bdellovibrionales bacterium]